MVWFRNNFWILKTRRQMLPLLVQSPCHLVSGRSTLSMTFLSANKRMVGGQWVALPTVCDPQQSDKLSAPAKIGGRRCGVV